MQNAVEPNPYQRQGAVSNSHVGRDFEDVALRYFARQRINLSKKFEVQVGVSGTKKKKHAFDLGCADQKILVECKSHRWTSGGHPPSAKLTTWNEAMLYFWAAPSKYRKVMFVLKDVRRNESLAEYYLRRYFHLIPAGVEFWEYCEKSCRVTKLVIPCLDNCRPNAFEKVKKRG